MSRYLDVDGIDGPFEKAMRAPMKPRAQCDKCNAADRKLNDKLQISLCILACHACGKTYTRCARHDGADGCKRSFTAHKGYEHRGRPVTCTEVTTPAGSPATTEGITP